MFPSSNIKFVAERRSDRDALRKVASDWKEMVTELNTLVESPTGKARLEELSSSHKRYAGIELNETRTTSPDNFVRSADWFNEIQAAIYDSALAGSLPKTLGEFRRTIVENPDLPKSPAWLQRLPEVLGIMKHNLN